MESKTFILIAECTQVWEGTRAYSKPYIVYNSNAMTTNIFLTKGELK